ncbi:MAG: hypothetical protein GF401_00335 [Chitinivibrionales bacterium]|nr:hypothetical protein [Chitinivibrionales bacterium]
MAKNTNFAVSILIYAFILLFSAGIQGSITILKSTPQKLVFTWEIEDFFQETITRNGLQVTKLDFKGANTELGEAGKPVLPAYSFSVGIPPENDIQIEFNSRNVERFGLPFPVETREARGNAEIHTDPAFTRPWISQPRYSRVRNHRVAQLVINPFVYDPATGTLRVLRSGNCTITFPPSPAYGASPPGRSEFLKMMERTILNYDVSSRWVRPYRPSLSKQMSSGHPLTDGTFLHFSIGDGVTGFNEGTSNQNGIIRITGQEIISTLGSSIPLNRLSLYASVQGEMNDTTPSPTSIPGRIVEIPLERVDVVPNGIVDASDYVLAYVTEASDWVYDSSSANFIYRVNRYTDDRHYWLKVNSGNGRLVSPFTPPAGESRVVTNFTNRILFKRPLHLRTLVERGHLKEWEGGLDRIWKRLAPGLSPLSESVQIPNLNPHLSGRIRVTGYSTVFNGAFSLSFAETQICEDSYGCQNNQWYPVTNWGINSDAIPLNVSFRSSSSAPYFDVQQVEIEYTTTLDMTGADGMTIFSSDTTGLVTYRLTIPASTNFHIFRVLPDETEISRVLPVQESSTSWSFTDTAGAGIKYYYCTDAGLKQLPSEATPVSPSGPSNYRVTNLRASNSATYLIITHPEFMDAAVELARHKASYPVYASHVPKVVSTTDIYREFSGGSVEPAALRNFIGFVLSYWSGPLDHVVLFGSGHYDYKKVSARETNYIPTAQVGNGTTQKCVEDFFACLDSNETWRGRPDIFLGRLPASSPTQAFTLVEKIKDMEDLSRADYGAWRNRVLLAADDDRQGHGYDGMGHHTHSEDVSAVIENRFPSTEIRKLYLFEYEFDEVYEKPEAARALANAVNSGVACVNYFGHGSDILWADEHILATDNLDNFHNDRRYCLVTSFSCSVGRFDKPDNDCLSSALTTLPSAGAIVGIASTRLAYAKSNKRMAISFYEFLFTPPHGQSIGEAFRGAMDKHHTEQKAYCLLGDPSIKFYNPSNEVQLQIISEKQDTLQALETITVRGTIVNHSTNLHNAHFGTANDKAYVHLGLYNPPEKAKRKDKLPEDVDYTLPGTPLFSGKTPVVNGTFEQSILLPRRMTFNTPGARLIAYAWHGEEAGIGHDGTFIFKGTVIDSIISDSAGPRISVRPVYHDINRNTSATFANEIIASLPVELQIELHDESGVDVVGSAPDEGLTIEIPGVKPKQNINHKFQFGEGDYRTGIASLSLEEGEVESGAYELRVGARDLLGNSTNETFTFKVAPEEEFHLGHVFNYPNPIRANETTRFYFYTSAASRPWRENDGVFVTIKIYTLSGKLIKIIRNARNGVEWNCTDEYGKPLGPNIYLYQITAESTNMHTDQEKSKVHKLVIHPPRRSP